MNRIYKEIGPGKRISATKLAVDKLEQTGRPFRLAIDISIWQFQVQAARGGSNPAIRTLFYRLLRLLGLSIQPIFVFDGPNKPVFKRNKRSGRGDGVATSMAKRMIRLFGFQIHDAPGEAEAECALLEQQGIVDAVLSEDVDTIMFGCRRTLRNWSSEGTKAKTPTHMSMYDVEELQKGGSGLDREGMVLVALMSGGDYIPEGIPGAGVKLACEAARAGFGKRLCQLKRADTSELNSWREWLVYELRHNESGFFRTRHKALHVPDDFPNLDVLRYYTHPVVSPAATLERLRNQTWEKPIDIEGLREFVRETFDWNYRIGAIKFIRVLAPCLLVRKLMDRNARGDQGSEDISSIQKEESELVNSISSRRAHFSTDATSELRISFIPTNIVGYDFQEEPDEMISYGRDGLALNSDDEFEALGEEEAEALAARTPKKPFSPTDPDLYWIPETIAKFGIPLMVEDWEAAQRNKAKGRQKAKAPKPKQKAKVGRASAGALDNFVKVTKNIPKSTGMGKPSVPATSQPEELAPPTATRRLRNPLSASITPSQNLSSPVPSIQIPEKTRPFTRSSKQTKSTTSTTTTKKSSRSAPGATIEAADLTSVTPWTIADSQVNSRRTTTGTNTNTTSKRPSTATKTSSGAIIIPSSSPPTSPPARLQPTIRKQQQHKNETSNSNISSPSSSFRAPSPSSSPLLINSSPPPRPNNKRRSITPPPPPPPPPETTNLQFQSNSNAKEWENTSGPAATQAARPSSPSPWDSPPSLLQSPSERPRRSKLARTESLPVERVTPHRKSVAATTATTAVVGTKTRRGFARAQTIAVDVTVLSDSDPEREGEGKGEDEEKVEEEEAEEDSDLDLPPLSSLVNKLPPPSTAGKSIAKSTTKNNTNGRTSTVSLLSSPPPPATASRKKSEQLRTTKLYVPRKSQPGYFKEIDVTVEEAEVLKAHVAAGGPGGGRGRAWRRSDIECIDLTGHD